MASRTLASAGSEAGWTGPVRDTGSVRACYRLVAADASPREGPLGLGGPGRVARAAGTCGQRGRGAWPARLGPVARAAGGAASDRADAVHPLITPCSAIGRRSVGRALARGRREARTPFRCCGSCSDAPDLELHGLPGVGHARVAGAHGSEPPPLALHGLPAEDAHPRALASSWPRVHGAGGAGAHRPGYRPAVGARANAAQARRPARDLRPAPGRRSS